jgi:hypothetical protein
LKQVLLEWLIEPLLFFKGLLENPQIDEIIFNQTEAELLETFSFTKEEIQTIMNNLDNLVAATISQRFSTEEMELEERIEFFNSFQNS